MEIIPPIRSKELAPLKLNLGYVLHVDEILYVPGLKKNLLFVSVLEDKGFRVIFMDNKALLWPKNTDLNFATAIGVREGFLHKVPGKFIKVMIHDIVSTCELWHRRLGHLHSKALPRLQKMVKGMSVFQSEHDGICRG